MLVVWHRRRIGLGQRPLPHGTVPFRTLLLGLKTRRDATLSLIIVLPSLKIALHAQFTHIFLDFLHAILIGEVLSLYEVLFTALVAWGQHFLLLRFDFPLLASLGGETAIIGVLYLLFRLHDATRARALLVALILSGIMSIALAAYIIRDGGRLASVIFAIRLRSANKTIL